MGLIFRNFFFWPYYFLRIQMLVILTFFNTRDLYSAIFQIVRSKGNHKKGVKVNHRRLIDFLSQISKLSYFNLLDLPDSLMHH